MSYIMAGQTSELERLRLQSRVFEPAGERLLARLGSGKDYRAVDLGCGTMGWLRILSEWAGEVVGTEIEDRMLIAANGLCEEESLSNVQIIRDDIFASTLPEQSFDLVHLRFQIAPLGRAAEQIATALRLVKSGGWVVLEEPDAACWRENPLSPAAMRLRELILEAFTRGGGDFNAGRRLPEYLRAAGIEPDIACESLALGPGHPYLLLPLQFATSLRLRLLPLVSERELDRLIEQAQVDLTGSECWGTTFLLIQAWGKAP